MMVLQRSIMQVSSNLPGKDQRSIEAHKQPKSQSQLVMAESFARCHILQACMTLFKFNASKHKPSRK